MGTDHSEKTTVRRGKKGTFWKQPEMFILRVSRLRGGGGGGWAGHTGSLERVLGKGMGPGVPPMRFWGRSAPMDIKALGVTRKIAAFNLLHEVEEEVSL